MLSVFPLANGACTFRSLALTGCLLFVCLCGWNHLSGSTATAIAGFGQQSGNPSPTAARTASTPAVQEKPFPLEPGKPVEREIARGQQQMFTISLTAGQFLRIIVHQQSVDVTVAIVGSDNKAIAEIGLTSVGGQESLSYEAAVTDEYRLLVKANPIGNPRGSYRLQADVKPSATEQDKKRITAERLMIEANNLSRERGRTAQQVIEKQQQALAIWRELGDQLWAACSLTNTGIAYFNLSRYEQAIEHLEMATEIYHQIRDRTGEGRALGVLAASYQFLSRYEKAIETFEQSLAITVESKDKAGELNRLNDLGTVYQGLNHYEKAIEYYEKVIQIRRELEDRVGEGRTLINLGGVYQVLGRYDKAVEINLGALVILREFKLRPQEGIVLNNLGESYELLSNSEKAIQHFEQALAIARELKDRNKEAFRLSNLGNSYGSFRRYDKAIEHLEQALAIQREGKYRAEEGQTLVKLGRVQHSLGKFEKAIEQYNLALEIAREVKSPADEATSLYQLARTELARGNYTQSLSYVEVSLKLVESLRSGLVSNDSRAAFFAATQNSYQLYIDVLMRQHQADPTKNKNAQAFEISERARARGLLEMLAESRSDIRGGVDAALLERERLLAKQFNEKAQRLTQSNTPAQLATLKQEISAIENDYEQVQAAIRRASPRYAALTEPPVLKLADIQQQLGADTLLLEYSLGDERSFLWVVGQNSLASYELPKREQIEQAAADVYRMLTVRSRNVAGETPRQRQARIAQTEAQLPAAARQLSQILLAPAAAQLGNKRLVIVADGALQYIPFAMLPDPNNSDTGNKNPQSAIRNPQSETPLVVNHELISLPSASTLAVMRKELAGRTPAPKQLAVFADPVFAADDPRLKIAAGKLKNEPASAVASRKIEHLSGDTTLQGVRRGMVIPRLPFTRQEANQILALSSADSSFKAVDFSANRASALSSELSQYRYLHFATHGYLDSERAGLSALVLSLVDEQGRQQDGFLRAHELYNLNLPAELVVLSACQTGLGKQIKGEGMIGLTRGFMHAGAARVVVSLWNVNDKATSELMTRFYQKMLKEQQAPAAALRSAQVEMWKQKAWQSPNYWAAFVLQGEWK
ncbi:MAG: CHAT domain-containing tetratricopeptide repeat protein [Acidobacteriota bacterium]|nr:CHAT domain-containing tetratricopeptide repeat protein [Acidobacteriota bacterium]